MTKFENSRENPFPFLIGCLDGTHFNIPTPSEDAISYYDRKGKHSVQMQAICDSQFRFLDVFIGYPGSCHDANVWRSSPVFNGITSGRQLAPGAIILGDSAKDNPLEHIDEMAPQQHGNIEAASELETLQDPPLWSAETDDENGVDRRNYLKTLFSS
ncbi:putative nuclease HARBI1 [Anastrepha obliqua]|uniref:putative nuclease HARBI1 n=1 Tax=Anastrepha obliqua TaxID=95512 RepID=UPI00240A459F|nr:putative nuclease HARBI1 [Anastrepha obliqua]